MPRRPMTMPLARVHGQSSLKVLDKRETTNERGYDADWKRLRKRWLQLHPLCRHHEKRGIIVPATIVNHIEDIRDRPDLRLDESNLESLCKRCHDRHTAIRMNQQRRRARKL